MTCRKNASTLTAAEKAAFVNALIALKQAPSLMGTASRYDDYVQEHMDAMMDGSAHRGPAFLPWHREYLRRLELDLQAIDPTVFIPYWDWTTDNSAASSIFAADFMGGDGSGPDYEVTTGPFAFSTGNWPLNIVDSDDPVPLENVGGNMVGRLRRRMGAGTTASTLPTQAQVDACLLETPYDSSPWTTGASPSFRDRLEGWHGAGSIHNRVHLWVAGGWSGGARHGAMYWGTSPNDPLFFLHHANVDRLWAIWQRQTGLGYLPVSGGPSGHNLNDSMSPWGGTSTPASTLDHHAMGYWYDDEEPEIDLLTPSVDFGDVPQGYGGAAVTTYRALVFEVRACEDVTLEIVAGPSTGFGTPLGTSVVVPHSPTGGPVTGRLWISYTTEAVGSSRAGTVTVQAVGTNPLQSWSVNLSAATVARKKAAVVLVLDRSGSMAWDSGDGNPRIDKLRQSAKQFVDLMQQEDGLGLVRYNHAAQKLSDVIDVGPVGSADRAGLKATLDSSSLDPDGATSIGDGILKGKTTLDAAAAVPDYDVRAMVVLTDGNENTPPMIASVASSITANTFAIGFGPASGVSASALQAITSNNNGYLLVTGTITPDATFRLSKYFLQVLAGVTNAQVVLDPEGELPLGAVHRIPFRLSEADHGLDVILLSPGAPYVDFTLESPDGATLDPGVASVEPNVEHHLGPDMAYYRLVLPAIPPDKAHAGTWHAVLRVGRKAGSVDVKSVRRDNVPTGVTSRGTIPYCLLVHARSDLSLRAVLLQKSVEPGADCILLASLTQHGVPLAGRASMSAEVTRPDGTRATIPLTEVDEGRFEAAFATSLPGAYPVRLRVTGHTFHGRPFQREQALSAVAIRGGDSPPTPSQEDGTPLPPGGHDAGGGLCEALLCLTDERVLRPEAARALERMGFDVDALRKCLREHCDEKETKPAPTRPRPVLPTDLRALKALLARPEAAPRLATAEPARPRPPPLPHHHEGPMFDLSPEDKAARPTRKENGKKEPRKEGTTKGGSGGSGGGRHHDHSGHTH